MQSYRQKGRNSSLILNHKTSSKVFNDSVVLIKGNAIHTTFYLDVGRQTVVTYSAKILGKLLGKSCIPSVHRGFMSNPNYVKNHD
jgi:hypothetical protein